MSMAGTLDSNFTKYFKKVIKLKNTAIILISDQGLHYGSYFMMPPGNAERGMPILYTRFPSRFKVTATPRELITPFDVHRTLLELVELP